MSSMREPRRLAHCSTIEISHRGRRASGFRRRTMTLPGCGSGGSACTVSRRRRIEHVIDSEISVRLELDPANLVRAVRCERRRGPAIQRRIYACGVAEPDVVAAANEYPPPPDPDPPVGCYIGLERVDNPDLTCWVGITHDIPGHGYGAVRSHGHVRHRDHTNPAVESHEGVILRSDREDDPDAQHARQRPRCFHNHAPFFPAATNSRYHGVGSTLRRAILCPA